MARPNPGGTQYEVSDSSIIYFIEHSFICILISDVATAFNILGCDATSLNTSLARVQYPLERGQRDYPLNWLTR